MSKHHIPPKERNNTFPQAKKALKNANDDVKEIMNNGILFGSHLSQGIKKYISEKRKECIQAIEGDDLDYRKELLHDSKELGKYTFMLVWHLLKSGGYTLYSALDYVDTKISKTGFLEKKENLTLWDKTKQKVIHNISKLLIGATLLGGGVYKSMDTHNTPSQHTITALTTSLPFEKNVLLFWDDNPDFFDTTLFGKELPKKVLAHGITIIRDAGLTFYVLHPEDCKAEYLQDGKKFRKNIIDKLAKFPEFSYLSKLPNDKTKSFNVPMDAVTNNKKFVEQGTFYLPIPLNPEQREISLKDFANYCHEAIQEMKTTGVYQEKMKELLALYDGNENRLIADILAFFRSETTEEYTHFTEKLGTTELHRREEGFHSFSLGYGHVLMEKNADKKTDGPGLEARKNLGLTEGQTYHPKNSSKLFLGYRFEKTSNLNSYFPLTDDTVTRAGKTYNGSEKYNDKLVPNRKHTTTVMEEAK